MLPTAIKALSCGPKLKSIKRFREFQTPFCPRDIHENPRSMYARVPQAMAQFVLKIEKIFHIMGPTPILEKARAYSLRPRLWLLFTHYSTLNLIYVNSFSITQLKASWIYLDIAAFQNFKVFLLLPEAGYGRGIWTELRVTFQNAPRRGICGLSK